jgi:DNA-binding NtrC family response regulator
VRKTFAPETLARLQRHDWPFNVRELQQVVESAVCLVDRDVVLPSDLPDYFRREGTPGASAPAGGAPGPLRKVVEEAERSAIVGALEFTGGNRRKAIELLQISPETFYRRLEEFGLHKKGE